VLPQLEMAVAVLGMLCSTHHAAPITARVRGRRHPWATSMLCPAKPWTTARGTLRPSKLRQVLFKLEGGNDD